MQFKGLLYFQPTTTENTASLYSGMLGAKRCFFLEAKNINNANECLNQHFFLLSP